MLNTGGVANGQDDFCIWSNNPDRSYFITASGDGASNAFTLSDGTRTTPYRVQILDSVSPFGPFLTPGVKSAKLTSNATSPDCGGATNSTVTVTIESTAISAMEATTTYTGVLTLLVTPS